MKTLPASLEWIAYDEARARYRRTRSDEDAVAMTNAWYAWRDSVEARRAAAIPEIDEIEEVEL